MVSPVSLSLAQGLAKTQHHPIHRRRVAVAVVRLAFLGRQRSIIGVEGESVEVFVDKALVGKERGNAIVDRSVEVAVRVDAVPADVSSVWISSGGLGPAVVALRCIALPILIPCGDAVVGTENAVEVAAWRTAGNEAVAIKVLLVIEQSAVTVVVASIAELGVAGEFIRIAVVTVFELEAVSTSVTPSRFQSTSGAEPVPASQPPASSAQST